MRQHFFSKYYQYGLTLLTLTITLTITVTVFGLTTLYGQENDALIEGEEYDDPVLIQQIYPQSQGSGKVDIFDVKSHPHRKIFISAGADKMIKIWDLKGQLLKSFRAHNAWVRSLAIHPKGQYIVSGGCDEFDNTRKECISAKIKVWNFKGELQFGLSGHNDSIWILKFLDENTLVSGGSDNVIRLWNFNSHRNFKNIPSPNGKILNFADTSSHLFVSDETGFIHTYGKGTYKLVKSEKRHEGAIYGLDVTTNFLRVTIGIDKKLVIEDKNYDILYPSVLNAHLVAGLVVKFSPNDKLIASAGCEKMIKNRNVCYKSTIKLWNIEGKLLKTIDGHGGSDPKIADSYPDSFFPDADGVWVLEFSSDGKQLISTGRDGIIKVWDVSLINITEGMTPEKKKNVKKVMKTHQKSLLDGRAIFYSSKLLNSFTSPISRKLGLSVPRYSKKPFDDIRIYKEKSMNGYLELKDKKFKAKIEDCGTKYNNSGGAITKEVVSELTKKNKDTNLLAPWEKICAIQTMRTLKIAEMEKIFELEGFRKVMKNFNLMYPRYRKDKSILEFELVAEGAEYSDLVWFKVKNEEDGKKMVENLSKRFIVVVYDLDENKKIILRSVILFREKQLPVEGFPISRLSEVKNGTNTTGKSTTGKAKVGRS